uniref:VOC domain-containing protein n=1 Tax=Salix viminalis TaxID=40686 RepID=A0A6N2KGW2_SALVM
MAEEAAKAMEPNADLLEWPKKDKRRLLHAVYRVGDLERTIKFYTEGFGMKLLRQRDIPEEKYSNAFLGFGPEESNFVVELTYNYGVTSYDIGTGFGHLQLQQRMFTSWWRNFVHCATLLGLVCQRWCVYLCLCEGS